MKKSDQNLSVIENFILHLTHCGNDERELGFKELQSLTPKIMYQMAHDYIKEDHVDGEENPYNDILPYKPNTNIFEELKKMYVTSEVTSGEFYHHVQISLGYSEEEVVKGIQEFLDWDNSKANFEYQKGELYWIIKDL